MYNIQICIIYYKYNTHTHRKKMRGGESEEENGQM